jgi:hypothetical protein
MVVLLLGCWTFSAGPLPLPNGHDKHTAGQYPAEEKKKKQLGPEKEEEEECNNKTLWGGRKNI